MQRSHTPIRAMAMPSQVVRAIFCLKNSMKIGTITISRLVMKPALPAVVYTIPICCSDPATKLATPQRRLPISSVLSDQGVISARSAAGLRSLILPYTQITGSSASEPSMNLKIPNVNGPMWSMPIFWNMKAEPQMTAASSRHICPLYLLMIKLLVE